MIKVCICSMSSSPVQWSDVLRKMEGRDWRWAGQEKKKCIGEDVSYIRMQIIWKEIQWKKRCIKKINNKVVYFKQKRYKIQANKLNIIRCLKKYWLWISVFSIPLKGFFFVIIVCIKGSSFLPFIHDKQLIRNGYDATIF